MRRAIRCLDFAKHFLVANEKPFDFRMLLFQTSVKCLFVFQMLSNFKICLYKIFQKLRAAAVLASWLLYVKT